MTCPYQDLLNFWSRKMISEKVEQDLRDALSCLYDPDYEPPESLYAFTGCDGENGPLAVQSVILRAIKELEPAAGTPASAHTRQVYDLLHNRFVERLTLEQTAESMHMSPSTAWRAQRTAVHTLAQALWQRNRSARQPSPAQEEQADQTPLGQATDWQTQVSQELALLEASDPNAVTDVGETIARTLRLMDGLLTALNVRVETKLVQPNLVTSLHPSVLIQVLIALVGRLAHYISSGPITIYANMENGTPKLTITGAVRSEGGPTEDDLSKDIVRPKDVSIDCLFTDNYVFLEITTPVVGRVTVLVVDDNEDMVRFYRRCTEGTRYSIVLGTDGPDLFETIKEIAPDVIILDIMLPDINGWELLMRLHEDHDTRGIPVVVSSVVKEEDLARSLGASHYLSKPVRPDRFIQILDQVLPPVASKVQVSRASNEAAC
jgi:CheY-like chemotaxis protein